MKTENSRQVAGLGVRVKDEICFCTFFEKTGDAFLERRHCQGMCRHYKHLYGCCREVLAFKRSGVEL